MNDEIQYLSQKELGALIMAMHKIRQKELSLVLIGAGLPILPGLAEESKSYAERLFNFLTMELYQNRMKKHLMILSLEGVSFEKDALEEIYRLTKGYPYFLQE